MPWKYQNLSFRKKLGRGHWNAHFKNKNNNNNNTNNKQIWVKTKPRQYKNGINITVV
jgi:hypothetical protein